MDGSDWTSFCHQLVGPGGITIVDGRLFVAIPGQDFFSGIDGIGGAGFLRFDPPIQIFSLTSAGRKMYATCAGQITCFDVP
jgi:hypothetical protein